MDSGKQLDPIVKMFMSVSAGEYAERIHDIESRLHWLQSSEGEERSYAEKLQSSPGAAKQDRGLLKSVRSFLTLWKGERKAAEEMQYDTLEEEFKAGPDDLKTKLGSLIASGRKLTEAQLLRGGASWHISPIIALGTWEATGRTAEVFAATPEQTEAARQEMNEALGIASEQPVARGVARGDSQKGAATRAEGWGAAASQYEEGTFREIAMQLRVFLRGPEGTAAMKLLTASGLRIVFAKKVSEPGRRWDISCLDHRGLSRDFTGMGGYLTWNELSAEDAVKAAWFENTTAPVAPREFMAWLRGCLDAVAQGWIVPGVERDSVDSR